MKRLIVSCTLLAMSNTGLAQVSGLSSGKITKLDINLDQSVNVYLDSTATPNACQVQDIFARAFTIPAPPAGSDQGKYLVSGLIAAKMTNTKVTLSYYGCVNNATGSVHQLKLAD